MIGLGFSLVLISQFEEIPDGKKYILLEYVSQNYLQFFFFKLRSAS